MQAYRKTLIAKDTTLVLSPDNEFLKYLDKGAGRRVISDKRLRHSAHRNSSSLVIECAYRCVSSGLDMSDYAIKPFDFAPSPHDLASSFPPSF